MKKLYVLAALEMDKFRKRTLEAAGSAPTAGGAPARRTRMLLHPAHA